MTKTANTAQDLRNVYLTTYANFAVSPSDIAGEVKGVNLRYARELLATLVEAGLVAKSEDGDGNDVWQTYPDTYDNMSEDEARARIDAWLDENAPKGIKPVKAKKEQTFHACYCGCGENVPSTSFYRPGHDARHAGVVGREIAANYTVKGFDRRDLLSALPSAALVAKAEGIAEKAIAKIEAKQDREAAREQARIEKQAAKDAEKVVEGTIKVGKAEYVAAKHPDGRITYFDAKGAEKVASKTAAATFEE